MQERKKAVVFGEKKDWEEAVNLVEKNRQDFLVLGLCDPQNEDLAKSNAGVYTIYGMIEAYKLGRIDAVIMTDASNRVWSKFFHKAGIEENYAIQTKYYKMDQVPEEEKEYLIRRYEDILPEIHNVEFHLADHCNLNCKSCAHFSNLVKKPVFADLDQFKKDLFQLRELLDNIREFYLLGGEPLLNPDAGQFFYCVRDAFPYTKLTMVTNGLLVPVMKPEVISAIKETDAFVSISDYQCLDEKRIKDCLKEYGIVDYDLRCEKDLFTKNLNLRGDSDPKEIFETCRRHQCTFLGSGKIAACSQPFTIHYFNEYYQKNISDQGAISLYEEGLTGKSLVEKLDEPMETCRYCTFEELVEWGISRDPVSMDDWCVIKE